MFFFYFIQFHLIFISVDGDNSREIFVLHCYFMTGLLAVEPRLKVQQCTVPATEIGNACYCNNVFIEILVLKETYLDTESSDNPSHENLLEKRTFCLGPLTHQTLKGGSTFHDA